MRLNILHLALCAALMLQPQHPFAAEKQQIDSVMVVSKAPRSPAKESAPLQIISSKKMETLGMKSLTEAVKSFSGVTIKDYGGIGGIKSVSIRNMGAEHTAVVYDGVSVSNAQGGVVDISSFSLDDIEEVSLTIGQGGEIFQAARNFASSGVLNLRSKRPTFTNGNYKIGLTYQMGSFNTYDPQLNLALKLNQRWVMTARGDWMLSEGDYPFTIKNGQYNSENIRSNSDVNTLSSEMNLYGKVGKSGTLTFKGSYLDSERGLPGSVVLYNDYANERTWERLGLAQANYENIFNERWAIKSAAKYSYNWSRYDSDYNTARGTTDLYTQQEYYATTAAEYRPTKGVSITLAEDLFFNNLTSTAADGAAPERLTSLTAAAAQYRADRLTASATLLYTHAREWVSGVNEPSPNRDHLSPAVSLAYKLLKGHDLRARASFKDSFRMPTFNDLYYTKMGNNKLEPERSKQYNAGMSYLTGMSSSRLINYLSLSVDGYYNSVDNKIVAVPGMFYWKMMNYGIVHSLGCDMNGSITLRLGAKVRSDISANYSYQHSVDKTTKGSDLYGNQLPYTPRNSGSVTAAFALPWLDVGYTLSAVGERYSNSIDSFMYYLEPYADHNITLSRNFNFTNGNQLKLRAEMLNITNNTYSVIQYYPMPGRNYRITITFNI